MTGAVTTEIPSRFSLLDSASIPLDGIGKFSHYQYDSRVRESPPEERSTVQGVVYVQETLSWQVSRGAGCTMW